MLPDPLVTYLNEQADLPFLWGALDCGCFVAGWVMARRGVDPLAPWRGLYRDALGNARMVAEHGGLVASFAALLADAGLLPIAEPGRGDVGVVSVRPHGPTGAICLGERRWAMKTMDGIGFVSASPMRAWAV